MLQHAIEKASKYSVRRTEYKWIPEFSENTKVQSFPISNLSRQNFQLCPTPRCMLFALELVSRVTSWDSPYITV